MSVSLLSVENIEVRYGAAVAVRKASLNVQKGQLVAIIGSNGAGKTSLMRGITGLVRPTAGRVMFKAQDTSRLPAHSKVARGLVMVPEGRMLFPDQTVEDNLILGAYPMGGLRSPDARRNLERALELSPACASACASRPAVCPAVNSRCSPSPVVSWRGRSSS
jgi:branched-chain amino acid transport system ATP-binding protein